MKSKRINCLSFCGIYRKGLTAEEKYIFHDLILSDITRLKDDTYFTTEGLDYLIIGKRLPASCRTENISRSGGCAIVMLNNNNHTTKSNSSADSFQHISSEFNSSWMTCFIDKSEEKVFFSRDPCGVQTVYVGNVNKSLLFTTSLTYFQQLKLELNTDAINNLLHFLYIPSPQTIYQNIRSLLPGESISFDGTSSTFNSIPKTDQLDHSDFIHNPNNYIETYESLLSDAANSHSSTSGKVGLFLSGGKDSSVLAIGAKLANLKNIEAITLGFSDRSIDEGEDARCVANHLGIPFRILKISDQKYQKLWPIVVKDLGQPMGDFAVLPVYAAIEELKEEFDIFWDGTGTDLPFGIPASWIEKSIWWLKRYTPHFSTSNQLSMHRKIPPRFTRIISMLERAKEEQFVSWNGWSSIEIAKMTGNSLNLKDTTLYKQYNICNSPMKLKTLTLTNIWETETAYRKVVQSAESNGVIVRFPFLDNNLISFTKHLPKREHSHGNLNKVLLRKIIYNHLPKSIFDKPKGSFAFPKRIILNGNNYKLLCDYLSDDVVKRHGILDSKVINQYIKEYKNGNNVLSDRIWIALMLHTWLEQAK
ncbi:MAG: asparagine synthase C-terminal domain-containing protein [Candidatus Thiodiazotropha sp. DIVDIV]